MDMAGGQIMDKKDKEYCDSLRKPFPCHLRLGGEFTNQKDSDLKRTSMKAYEWI